MNLRARTQKLFFIIAGLLFSVSLSYAQTSVTDFDGLQNALSSPEVYSVSFETSLIDFTGDIAPVYARSIAFTADQPPVMLDGNSLHRGFAAYNDSSLSFDNILFSNMKTPSLFNSSALNYGGALMLSNSYAAITGKNSSFNANRAVTGGAVYAEYGSLTFSDYIYFYDNKATLYGGALALFNSYAYINSGGNFHNNSAATGGAVYLRGGSLYAYETVDFYGNSAELNGGAFAGENYSSFSFYGQTNIENNSAQEKGGGFYLNLSDAEFFSAAGISDNTALLGGGFAAENDSIVSFDSAAVINNNSATLNGGGFYSNNSATVFWSSVEISNNTSRAKGGGLYAVNDSLVLGYGESSLTGNTAYGDGGGFYAGSASGVSFGKSLISNNISYGSGGGFASDASEVYFDYEAGLISNHAYFNGGAFSAVNGSEVTFDQTADFTGNTAGHNGGAFYSGYSGIIFNYDVNFNGNAASASGGTFFTDNSAVIFSGNNSFTGNSALNYGGAAAITNNSTADFRNGSSFTDNSAAAGGALFIDSSDVYLIDPDFNGNTAYLAGGAAYLQGSRNRSASLNVKVTADASVFSGNTANGQSNALHIGDYSSVYFDTAEGTSVEMYDGITSGNINAYFSYSGEGDFNFYGDASGSHADITINARQGAAFNLKSGAKLAAGNFYNAQESVFNMKNSQRDAVNAVSFTNDGIVNMEVFSLFNSNDSITASGGVKLGEASVLNVYDDLTDRNFRSKTYKLIGYGENLTGIFGEVNFNSAVAFLINPVISYGDFLDNWITVTYRGDLDATNFRYLSGLSFNQRQTAKTFDALSENSSGDMDNLISAMEAGSEEDIKKSLAQSSGYFLANVIRSAVTDSESKQLYDRIKNHCSYGHESGGMWAQFNYNSVTNVSDKNSLNDYKDNVSGITAGFDIYNNGKVIGFYGKHNSHDIRQDPKNKAGISSSGIGVYGGIVKNRWEIKADINGSYNNFSTERHIPFLDRTAKADFNGTSFGADMEGALKYSITYNLRLRPFIGFEVKRAGYENFSESKAESLNLDVEEGSYVRSAARTGVGAVYEKRAVAFHINGEMKYLLSSEYPEIKSSFEDTGLSFRSRGASEGRTELGASAGASVRITEPLKIFTNTSFFAAERYSNFYINFGIRYNFCNLKLKNEPKPNTAADGFTYAPPPDFTDYSPLNVSSGQEKEKAPLQDAAEKKLSDEFFDSLMTGIGKNELSKDMIAALGAEKDNAAISIELVKPETGEDGRITENGSANAIRTYVLNMSNFVINKAQLTEKAKNDLIFIANEIMSTNYKSIKIEGHTDSTGNDAVNSRLSKERAKAVYDIFVKSGIPSGKMYHLGMSSKKPAATNDTKEGRAKNRRVEVTIE